jgi:hypothetical protein
MKTTYIFPMQSGHAFCRKVPHKATKKTSTVLGFDLKVLSAKYKSEAETDAESSVPWSRG